ncbi:alkane hydroxylase MAH1-like [Impatiens glandulifera]|uniref:alkane hydroxylase MAH1-like n=1 Tax=Impatiens glandulifera TaxID=253017 RepID=UPI001FB0FEA4|nr:alkane hydroxylase MAH1-like [Impatiens glandulifera]
MAVYEFLKEPSSTYVLLLLFLISLIISVIIPYVCRSFKCWHTTDPIPICWPVVRMLPALFHNSHRLHEFATDVLILTGGTFNIKGPWFANSDLLITSDPANIHHILSRNFANYPKGPQFRKIFQVLGDGIFNADSEIWEYHRKITMSFFNHSQFGKLLIEVSWEKVEAGLIPVMENFSGRGLTVDLQDMFQRFTFDTICVLTLGHDPQTLSIDLPDDPTQKAVDIIEEAILYRHILPESLWRLQKWLRVGMERKLAEASTTVDNFFYSCIEKYNNPSQFSAIGLYSKVYKEYSLYSSSNGKSLDVFLRDTLLNLMVAGRDTTSSALSWFFWLLARNPQVGKRIREEIEANLNISKGVSLKDLSSRELGELVYLHGALCETLRLFPSVAFEHKSPLQPDVLPSGERVMPNTMIVLSFYSMGRMESIWGKDFMEFKPERWISDHNKNRNLHVPSFKFPAFNAGPRTCLGKEMAFTQMKIVASIILLRYEIQVVEDHPVMPASSIVLHMKHGLKVRITPRD